MPSESDDNAGTNADAVLRTMSASSSGPAGHCPDQLHPVRRRRRRGGTRKRRGCRTAAAVAVAVVVLLLLLVAPFAVEASVTLTAGTSSSDDASSSSSSSSSDNGFDHDAGSPPLSTQQLASSVIVEVGPDGSTAMKTTTDIISDAAATATASSTLSSSSSFQCGIYMAPSTISGAGIGVFTGVDRSVGDVVGSGDAIIPVVDVQYHLRNYPGYDKSNQDETEGDDDDDSIDDSSTIRPTVEFTVDYVWNGVEMGMARETAFGTWNAEGVTAYCPGLDAAINCHLALVNVDKSYPQYDNMQLHRSKDPGAGAFSPYHNCTTVATASIPAGAELFKFYGENWFITRSETFPTVPLNDNYNAADQLIRDMDELLDSLQLLRNSSTTVDEDLYRILSSSPYQSTSRTLTALPKPQHLDAARQSGVRSTNQPGATKSLQDLQSNGQCVDTIAPGKSTIPQAGRGAFARTSFRPGQIVTGTPILVCDSIEYMTLYDGDWWERSVPPTDRKVGNQLVLNYCHQHPSSPSLFLCPYGYLVNYINHAPTAADSSSARSDNTTSTSSSDTTTTTTMSDSTASAATTATANVKLVWAQDGSMGHNASLLTQSPRHIVRASPGLFWHYVAIRDIHEGDEILLDYGDLWQQAWDQHVREFEQQHRHRYDPHYRSAREYNLEHANATIRTAKEQLRSPYPGHLELRCLNELGDNGTNVVSTLSSQRALDLWTTDNVGSRCTVIGRDWQHDRYLYRVEIEYQVWEYDANSYRFDSMRIVKRVERAALRFFDVPYSTDLFLPTAFRHPMGIPDDMFPEAWRNYHGYHHHKQKQKQHKSERAGSGADGSEQRDVPGKEALDVAAAASAAAQQATIAVPETVVLQGQ